MKLLLKLLQVHRIRKLRMQRHARTLLPKKSVFFHESAKNAEKIFFWRVLSIATLGLFFFSIVPRFAVSGIGYAAALEEGGDGVLEELVFVEDGFLMKPEMWTEVGDRSDVGGKIDYTVQANDTISGIARKFGVTQSTIVQNNDFLDPKKLKPGMVLKIPSADGLLHIVQKGETLEGISKKYEIEMGKILTQNQMQPGSVLAAGHELVIPGAKKAPPPPPEPVLVASRNGKATGGGAAAAVKGKSAGKAARGPETYGQLLFPTKGKYTQYYHYGHYAVDIAQNGGASVWAADGGTVVRAAKGWNGGYGNVVVVDHGNGMTTLYAHLKDIYVKAGQEVGRGEAVGYMGNSGRVYGRTGIHLHFEVIVRGAKKNPLAYF